MNSNCMDCRVATLLAMTAPFVIASEAWRSMTSGCMQFQPPKIISSLNLIDSLDYS